VSGNKNPVPAPPAKQQQAPKQSCDVKVTIGRVIRGNPYVDRGATSVKGLPDSLPPSKTYQVEIKVEPPLEKLCPQEFIEVSIVGGSEDNGTATVSPTKITRTTTVTVTGGNQTNPKSGGNLKIQASLSGKKVLATSAGFTVCAHPLNFKNVFDSNIDETLQEKHVIGMYVKDSWESDSGAAALNGTLRDLNKVQIKELVLESRPKEPPFHDYPSDHSDYNLGIIFSTDRHSILYPDAGPQADWVKPQLSIYKCDRCGCKDIVMPNSGLHIIFHVVNDNGFKFFAEKVGTKVVINGFAATAANAKVKSTLVPLKK
jgi:hypothetical protein